MVLQLEYQRTETEGPVFERLRAKLMGVASHIGMDKVFHLRGADIYRVLEMRRVPGRKELPAAQPRVDLPTNSRLLSERMAHCEDLADLLDTLLGGLGDLLRIDHAMLWLFDSSQQVLTLLASRGYEIDGAGAEISVGEGTGRHRGARRRADPRRPHDEHGHLRARRARPRRRIWSQRRAASPRFRCPDSRNRAASSPCRCARADGCSARCWWRACTTSISATTTKTR